MKFHEIASEVAEIIAVGIMYGIIALIVILTCLVLGLLLIGLWPIFVISITVAFVKYYFFYRKRTQSIRFGFI